MGAEWFYTQLAMSVETRGYPSLETRGGTSPCVREHNADMEAKTLTACSGTGARGSVKALSFPLPRARVCHVIGNVCR